MCYLRCIMCCDCRHRGKNAGEHHKVYPALTAAPINAGVDMDTVDRGIFRYRKFRVHEIIVVASEQKDENFFLPLYFHGIMTN